MATTLKYKDTSGNVQTVNIDPTYEVVLTLPTDTTQASIKVESPNYNTTTEYVGGRPKRD